MDRNRRGKWESTHFVAHTVFTPDTRQYLILTRLGDPGDPRHDAANQAHNRWRRCAALALFFIDLART